MRYISLTSLEMISTLKLALYSILVAFALSLILRAKRRRGLKVARGPPNPSWLVGS